MFSFFLSVGRLSSNCNTASLVLFSVSLSLSVPSLTSDDRLLMLPVLVAPLLPLSLFLSLGFSPMLVREDDACFSPLFLEGGGGSCALSPLLRFSTAFSLLLRRGGLGSTGLSLGEIF